MSPQPAAAIYPEHTNLCYVGDEFFSRNTQAHRNDVSASNQKR